MTINVILGILIFGYAGWALINYGRKTKQGKCAGCSLNNTCQTQTSCADENRVQQLRSINE